MGSASAACSCSTLIALRLAHAPQHVTASGRCVFPARHGVPSGRPLRDAGEDRDLRNRQLAERLAEIGLRGGRDAIRALAEEARIQIELENLVLRELLLHAVREDHFLVLRDEPLEARVQSRSLHDVERARNLLCDRATADLRPDPLSSASEASNHAAIVDAGVLEEVLVLGRQHGLDQQRRHVRVDDRRPLQLAEFVDEPAVAAIHLEGYLNLDVAQLGGIRQARRDVVIGADEQAPRGAAKHRFPTARIVNKICE